MNRLSIMRKISSGFTIVEMITIVTVISILASVAVVNYNGWKQSIMVTQLKSDLNVAAGALENYRNYNNSYPEDVNSISTFSLSEGVVLSGGSSDGGETYCISSTSSQFPELFYYINSSDDSDALPGQCP